MIIFTGTASIEVLAHGAPAVREAWSPRLAIYPGTVERTDLAIPMSDGVVLRGDLELPADESGKPIDKRFPVIVTITAYNKASGSFSGGLTGGSPSYLVQRGYAQLTVDARGTGSSEGQWAAFSRREDKDAGEIVEWAHSRTRPWSNGKVGISGPSYLGMSQIFAAGSRPAGLKAIFPQVPAADVYRDVVASGGQIDVGFIPLWLGLVTGTGVVPPAVAATDPQSGFGALVDHLTAAMTFTIPLRLKALTGGEEAYDGPFYRDRSPDRVIDRVQVPTFLVGGESAAEPAGPGHARSNDLAWRGSLAGDGRHATGGGAGRFSGGAAPAARAASRARARARRATAHRAAASSAPPDRAGSRASGPHPRGRPPSARRGTRDRPS